MPGTFSSRTFSLPISRPFQEVYDFLALPDNYPKWAAGLCTSLENINGEWLAETAQGKVKLKFTARNPFGVLDHVVLPGQGAEIYIPMRLIVNGSGCEVSITLFRLPETSEENFIEDCRWVERDLNLLKVLLEKKS